MADLVTERWHGDLRRLHDEADGDAKQVHPADAFYGIGPTGADIFIREVQGVWPAVAPYVDARARSGAERAGLPTDAHELLQLAGSPVRLAAFTSVLVAASLSA